MIFYRRSSSRSGTRRTSSRKGNSDPAVGIVIGVIFLLAILAVVGLCIYWKIKRRIEEKRYREARQKQYEDRIYAAELRKKIEENERRAERNVSQLLFLLSSNY